VAHAPEYRHGDPLLLEYAGKDHAGTEPAGPVTTDVYIFAL